MLNSRRYKILRLLLCSVLLFWLMNFVYYLKSTDVSLFKENISAERKLLWTQEEENGRIEDLRLKKKENEVPVVIVDQHQEGKTYIVLLTQVHISMWTIESIRFLRDRCNKKLGWTLCNVLISFHSSFVNLFFVLYCIL